MFYLYIHQGHFLHIFSYAYSTFWSRAEVRDNSICLPFLTLVFARSMEKSIMSGGSKTNQKPPPLSANGGGSMVSQVNGFLL